VTHKKKEKKKNGWWICKCSETLSWLILINKPDYVILTIMHLDSCYFWNVVYLTTFVMFLT
jgi:hypothetical protein